MASLQKIVLLSGARHLGINKLMSDKVILKCINGFHSDGEARFEPQESVKGKEIIVVQSCYRPNDHLLELLIAIDSLKRGGAASITVLTPYFPYTRSDKLFTEASAIGLKVVASLLEQAKIDRLIVFDMHSRDSSLAFNLPVVHMSIVPLLARYFKDFYMPNKDWVVCAARENVVEPALQFAELAGIENFILYPKKAKEKTIRGRIKDKTIVIYNDMVDHNDTIYDCWQKVLSKEPRKVILCGVHGVFPKGSEEKFKNVAIWVSDTLPWNIKVPYYTNYAPSGHFLRQVIESCFSGAALHDLWDEGYTGDIEYVDITDPDGEKKEEKVIGTHEDHPCLMCNYPTEIHITPGKGELHRCRLVCPSCGLKTSRMTIRVKNIEDIEEVKKAINLASIPK